MTRLLEIRGLTKAFGGQLALDGVDLAVESGEIVALAGANGSGKSTLIKVMAGYHQPDAGKIDAFGQEIWPHAVDQNWRTRTHFIHQNLGLVPTLNATENLALGSGYMTGRGRRIHWAQQRAHAEKVLGRYGADCDVDAPVATLSMGNRTIVAIARAMDGWEDPEGLLFVDEPTAALHEEEAEILFGAIRSVAKGGAGVVFVSHRTNEVLELANRVAVLRDGRLVADRVTAELDEPTIVELIAGRRIEELYPTPPPPQQDVVLEVDGIAGKQLQPLSFKLRRGEILGVAGLNGSGRDELPRLMFGRDNRTGGEMRLHGKPVRDATIRDLISAGIALIPADRQGEGLVMRLSARENMTLVSLAAFWRHWHLSRHREDEEVDEWITRLDIQPPDPAKPLDEFSGGNQQKVVMAKWLRLRPEVIILDEPTQGVDVSAKSAIHELLVKAASDGASLIVCSSEAKPLAVICDRVIVLRDGRVAAELEGEPLSAEAIVHHSITARTDHISPTEETLFNGAT